VKVQPDPCPLDIVPVPYCQFISRMDSHGVRWTECLKCGRRTNFVDNKEQVAQPEDTVSYKAREQVNNVVRRTEGIDAQQIGKPETHDGRGRTRSQVREEGWRAAERGKRIQSSGQRKREAQKKAQKKQ
jgi:hypothetical protein